jgi:alkylation response protein AidB-like acyl-CoA dehydrogenase
MSVGSVLGAWAIKEPGASSDVTVIRTVATPKNNGYAINGTKIFITDGGVSDIVMVVAYTDNAKAYKGINMLVVPKDTRGFYVGKGEKKLGIRGSETRELIFED